MGLSPKKWFYHLNYGCELIGGSPYLNDYYPCYEIFIGNAIKNKFILKKIYNVQLIAAKLYLYNVKHSSYHFLTFEYLLV